MKYADKVVPTGPIDFLSLVDNASVVVTDSFHGTAFSINLHTPFFVFDRNYGNAHSQSSRVESLLQRVNFLKRYEPVEEEMFDLVVDFSHSDDVLSIERKKAKLYLSESIESINN